MKPKILFVDDEPNILDSLRLMLRSMRTVWEMNFANGGVEALALLEKNPHDVVVSDMRMPGMDGAQLLREVQAKYPETVRMILSGYSEQESVMRTVKLAHQYLSKPCRPEVLKEYILKALRLRDIIQSPDLRRLISKIEALPSLPQIYNKLMAELSNENASLKRIADIVSEDVGMSTNVLKLVNSAFFGLPIHAANVHHAVNLLGAETIRVLVLSIHLFSTLPYGELPGFSLKKLWDHCSRVSCLAKNLAKHERASMEAQDSCFIAGMLHDVGKLLLLSSLPDAYKEVVNRAQTENRRLAEVEREMLGATHAELGGYLISLWGFKDSIVEAICWHHVPEKVSLDELSPLTIVTVANAFDHELVVLSANRAQCRVEQPCIPSAGYEKKIEAWRSVCERIISQGEQDVDTGKEE
jgi:HD-like signal output (HDOD) protein/CheY-like chemotaxis protein